MTTPNRALVTGAAGFIGAALCTRLRADGRQVCGVDSGRAGDWTRLGAAIDRSDVDIRQLDPTHWAELLAGVDTVFHLAAEKYNSSKSTPAAVIDTNITATHSLLTAAARAGVRKVVFTSSLYAYGATGPQPMRETDLLRPTTVYGMSKVAGENLLRVAERDSGLAWSAARLFFVFGPRQHAGGGYPSVIVTGFDRISRGLPPVIRGDGSQALDYVYLDDAVDALVRLADPRADGKILNVGTGEATTVRDLTRAILSVSESRLEPVFAAPDWTAGTVRVSDPGAARRELGWEATTTMAEGLRRIWQQWT